MLARTFKTPAELFLRENEYDALVDTLALMEDGKLQHVDEDNILFGPGDTWVRGFSGHFNMSCWGERINCGTVGCIGGTAELIGKLKFERTFEDCYAPALHDLFFPGLSWDRNPNYDNITIAQAAKALRNYLTRGFAHWEEILPEADMHEVD